GRQLDGLSGRDLDGVAGGGVAALTGGPLADCEREEPGDAHLFALARSTLEGGLQRAQDGVDRLLLKVGGVGDRGHQFLPVHEVSSSSVVSYWAQYGRPLSNPR